MGESITDIDGVFAGAVSCGIRANNNPPRKDLAYIHVPEAVAAAGVFTKNKFIAPCLSYSKQCLSKQSFESGILKAVVINSGNANAATGKQGLENAQRTSARAAELLGLKPEQVAVSSTGIIGVQLPMDKVEAGLNDLLKNPKLKDGEAVAQAIMTTDLVKKSVFVKGLVGDKEVSLAGIAKGSGMIAPNMGTMLGFLVTDAALEQSALQVLLQEAVDETFNMVSVDSDTSTNDMVLIFATGAKKIDIENKLQRSQFTGLLQTACLDLAKKIARDGEGATKLLEVQVHGAESKADARAIALSVVNSPLLKTAVHGADPNWGRVIMAVGKTPNVNVNSEKTDVYIGNEQVLSQGGTLVFNRDKAIAELKQENVVITIDLNLGSHKSTAWGCDLTKGYIDINVDYS